jgi:cytochrome c oxidase subunit 2
MMNTLKVILAGMAGVVAAGSASAAEPLALPAPYWDQIFNNWLILVVGIYVIVALPMLYFMVRYRYRPAVNEVGSHEEAGVGIEILWTVVPLIIVIYLATHSFALYTRQRTPPPDSLPVKVQAQMWSWTFEYQNGKQSISELYVPVGKPVKLLMTSNDVIHAFHILDAKTMEDVVPGRETNMWFQFNKTGEYLAFCREYCGAAHSMMRATIKVVTQDEFDAWLQEAE